MQKNQNRDWRNVIFINEWTFYLKQPRRKKWIKNDNNFVESCNFKQKKLMGFLSNGKCILILFQRKYE